MRNETITKMLVVAFLGLGVVIGYAVLSGKIEPAGYVDFTTGTITRINEDGQETTEQRRTLFPNPEREWRELMDQANNLEYDFEIVSRREPIIVRVHKK